MSEPAGAGGAPTGRLAFVLALVLMDVIGFGLIVPVLPELVSELGQVGMSEAAGIGGWIIMAYALTQLFFAPILGGISDAYGRRPVLLMSTGGFAVSMLIIAFAPSLLLLFVARALAGVTGASVSAANAYIADITTPERRAQTFGLLGVVFGIGFALGPALGGLIGAFNPRWPFLAAAGLATLNLTLGLFLLPESLAVGKRRPFDWRRSNILGSLGRIGRLGGHLRRFAIVYFLWYLALQSMFGIWSYIAAYRYQWSPSGIGLSLMVSGVMAILVNGLLVKRSVGLLGEWRTARAGLALGIGAFLLLFFADTPALAYAGIMVHALGGLVVPSLQAMMTQRMEADSQGELQGALTTIASLTIIIGPPMLAHIFELFTGSNPPMHLPGSPFVVSALLALSALVLLSHREPD